MGRSLFRPRDISGEEIARKRAAITREYTAEWAAHMPWYQVLAIYKKFEKEGRFEKRTVNYPAGSISPARKAKNGLEKDSKDGIQLSIFDEDFYERQESI